MEMASILLGALLMLIGVLVGYGMGYGKEAKNEKNDKVPRV